MFIKSTLKIDLKMSVIQSKVTNKNIKLRRRTLMIKNYAMIILLSVLAVGSSYFDVQARKVKKSKHRSKQNRDKTRASEHEELSILSERALRARQSATDAQEAAHLALAEAQQKAQEALLMEEEAAQQARQIALIKEQEARQAAKIAQEAADRKCNQAKQIAEEAMQRAQMAQMVAEKLAEQAGDEGEYSKPSVNTKIYKPKGLKRKHRRAKTRKGDIPAGA